MDDEKFYHTYRAIIKRAVAKLKNNRFACFVVSNARNKQGFFRDLVGFTTFAFEQAGVKFYNEAVLITPIGSLPMRARTSFANRKLSKGHQNVLVFYKGDPNKIQQEFGEVKIKENL